MNKRILTISKVLILSGLLSSCSKSGEEAVKQAENDVFAVHDEVMPKIDDVMKLRKQLRQRMTIIDSVNANGSASVTLRANEERDQARRLAESLTVADSLMMNWMSQYNNDTLTKLKPEDALRYLDEQKEKINDVKTKINSSLTDARQFLEKPQ